MCNMWTKTRCKGMVLCRRLQGLLFGEAGQQPSHTHYGADDGLILTNRSGAVEVDEARFWDKVCIPNFIGECWGWKGWRNNEGYSYFHVGCHKFRAHRLAYLIVFGDTPSELVLDHLCRNRACVNPYHLEAVTNKSNLNRGIKVGGRNSLNSRKTHCIRGHPLIGDNLTSYGLKNGQRICKTCKYAAKKEYRRRHSKQ